MLVGLWITNVVREIFPHWTSWEFLFEKINLVEEQDDGSVNKPLRVAYALEQHQRFLHLVLENKVSNPIPSQNSGEVYCILILN